MISVLAEGIALSKRKYGNYPGFELPNNLSGAAIKRLSSHLSSLASQTSDETEKLAEPPECTACNPTNTGDSADGISS